MIYVLAETQKTAILIVAPNAKVGVLFVAGQFKTST